jgi:SET domain-containing protein
MLIHPRRALQARYECVRGRCPCGDRCHNQRFQSGSAVSIAVVDCDRRDVGVITLESLPAGVFVGEYVGEVVSGEELQRRREVV